MNICKKKNHLSIVLIILGFFLTSSNLFSQINDKSVTELETIIDSIIHSNLKSQNIPGAAYILVDKNKTLLKKGFGIKNVENKESTINSDSTIFRIGSITKTFTAAALLHLLEKNKISIHDDINNHLTSIKIPATFDEPITFHHLLTHSSPELSHLILLLRLL